MRTWQSLAVGLAVVAVAALVYPLVLTQNRLRATQIELEKANEQVVQVRAGTGELERVIANLKTELDAANKSRTELQGNLDEATSKVDQLEKQFEAVQAENEGLKAQLDKAKQEADEAKSERDKQIADIKSQAEAATAQVTQVTADRNTALSKLAETQSQLESVESGFEKAKVANVEASKKLTELQANLDQATAEVVRLRNALEQKEPTPSQDVDSESAPPIE